MESGEVSKQAKNMSWLKVSGSILITGFIGGLISVAYTFHWEWTGFMASVGPDMQQYQPTKTLWDWLQLLIIPGVFLFIAFRFNLAANRNKDTNAQRRAHEEQERALDQQRETLLQEYLNRMSELLLNNDLRTSSPDAEVRGIARARTLTALYRLDPARKGSLIRFLYESGLICKGQKESVIDLSQADLSDVNLERVNLSGVNLSQANLIGAKLRGINLSEAQLQGTCLYKADLSGAILRDANLCWADLREAILNSSLLQDAKLIQADLSEAQFIQADITRANFGDALVNNARFEQTNLDGALISQIQRNKFQKA